MVRICQLQQVLAEALGLEMAGKSTASTTAWREAACRHLAMGTLTTPSLPEIAASMHVSYTLFRKRFLQVTGHDPKQVSDRGDHSARLLPVADDG